MLEILNTAGPYDKMIVVIEPNKDTWVRLRAKYTSHSTHLQRKPYVFVALNTG